MEIKKLYIKNGTKFPHSDRNTPTKCKFRFYSSDVVVTVESGSRSFDWYGLVKIQYDLFC